MRSIVCNLYITHPVFLFCKQHVSNEAFLSLVTKSKICHRSIDQLTWVYFSLSNVFFGNIQKGEEKPIFNGIDLKEIRLE